MKLFVIITINLCVVVMGGLDEISDAVDDRRNQQGESFEGQKLLGSYFYAFMTTLKGLYNTQGVYFSDDQDPALYYGTTNAYGIIRYMEPYNQNNFRTLTWDQIQKCLDLIPNVDDVRLQIKDSIEYLCGKINQDPNLGDEFKYQNLILKEYLFSIYSTYGTGNDKDTLFKRHCIEVPQYTGYA